jgi:hypothetical protein
MHDRRAVKAKKQGTESKGGTQAAVDDLPDLDDPEMNVAATKIQSSFRGHRTRRDLEANNGGV